MLVKCKQSKGALLQSDCVTHIKRFFFENLYFLVSQSRAWCKTNVTTAFYIRIYNSFAPSPRNAFWA